MLHSCEFEIKHTADRRIFAGAGRAAGAGAEGRESRRRLGKLEEVGQAGRGAAAALHCCKVLAIFTKSLM